MSNSSTIAPVQVTARQESFVFVAIAAVRANGMFIAITLLYASAFLVLKSMVPTMESSAFGVMALGFLASVLPPMVLGIFLSRVYVVVRFEKPKHPLLAITKSFWVFISDRNRLLVGLPVFLIFFFFMFIYSEIKTNIPLINPFSWDSYFAQLDRTLHFGIDPWKIVDPFFRLSDYLIFILNANYGLWFLFMWFTFTAFAFRRELSVERTRFFLTFFITWGVGGSLFAVYMSSAGPAFYTDLGLSPDPYAPLMQHLAEVNKTVPIWALDLQRLVWDGYANKGHNFGISAMPSMHNATALLLALGAWKLNRAAGILLSIHAFLIFIGSFYLAWHYAVDAYLGWAITLIAWFGSAPIANWWHQQDSVISFNKLLKNGQ